MVRRVWIVLLVLAAVANVTAQLPPPPPPPPPAAPTMDPSTPVTGTGAISGIVTDGTTGAPLPGVLVALIGGAALGGPGLPPRPRQTTDSKGRFIFTGLPASPAYSLTASAIGFLDGGYRRVPGASAATRLVLADGQWFTDANISLWRPAAISGTVRDERGEPLVGIPVRVLAGVTVGGRARWAAGPQTQTDDRGMYRIAGLQRGRYLVHVPSVQITMPSGEVAMYRAPARGGNVGAAVQSVERAPLKIMRTPDGTGVVTGFFPSAPADARGSAYPGMFHPAARAIDAAEPVTLEFGDHRASVDVQMMPVPTVSISGSVAGPADAIGGLPVRLLVAGNEELGAGGEAGLTKTNAAGHFTLHRVPQGRYVLLAGRTVTEFRATSGISSGTITPAAANMFANRTSSMQTAGGTGVSFYTAGAAGLDASGRLELEVASTNIDGLVIPVTPAVSVSGRFVWDGSETPPAGLTLVPSVRLEPADGDPTLGALFGGLMRPPESAVPLTFTIDHVRPGNYVFSDVLGASQRLVGVTWQGRNLIDNPLEVTGDRNITDVVVHLSSQRNTLKGSAAGEDGRPPDNAIVLAFPAQQEAWRNAGVSGVRFRTTTVVGDGTFEFQPLLPGDYLIAAIPMEDRGLITDPAYLSSIAARASRVRVDAASNTTLNLRLIARSR